MNEIDRLNADISELGQILSDFSDAEPWSAEWMNRQTLLTRENELRHELAIAEGDFELQVSLAGGTVLGSAIEVGFLGRFLERFQMTVMTVAQAIMHGDVRDGPIGGDVTTETVMRLVGTAPGSFVIGLEGPDRWVERNLGWNLELDEPVPVFDEAIDRVMDVIDVAEHDVDAARLPVVVGSLGGHRPLSHIVELARLLASTGTSTRAVRKSPFFAEPREVRLSASGARRLETLLTRTEQETETITIRGQLTGVRWKSTTFDLEPDDESETISGKISRDLREEVRSGFDRYVELTVEKTTVRTHVEGEETVTYQLVGISVPKT